jgi:hypothetical protein
LEAEPSFSALYIRNSLLNSVFRNSTQLFLTAHSFSPLNAVFVSSTEFQGSKCSLRFSEKCPIGANIREISSDHMRAIFQKAKPYPADALNLPVKSLEQVPDGLCYCLGDKLNS